ncbi:MAG: STAS domain-containing protein [Bryobacteraceae bacterium]|nr:STAS domain-containing protein [Bryobacteraceae bacterium]
MALEIEQREREGIVLLDLKGRLIVGEPVSALRERITQLCEMSERKLILNMEHVDYIDSTGLGGMVISFTSLKKQGGLLKLLNVSKRNIELLVLTKLTTVFELFDDEQEAVNSFFPTREIRKFDILEFVRQQEQEDAGTK